MNSYKNLYNALLKEAGVKNRDISLKAIASTKKGRELIEKIKVKEKKPMTYLEELKRDDQKDRIIPLIKKYKGIKNSPYGLTSKDLIKIKINRL